MASNQKDYKPIACAFHDVLLHHATKAHKVELVYNEDSIQNSIETIIKDVFTEEGEEFLLTSSGLKLRLDKIISVNGQKLASFC